MLKKYKNLPWPRNLWSTVFDNEIPESELPKDWEQALERIFDSLSSKKRAEILILYFRDNHTLKEIGEFYGTTEEPVRQHAEKALRAIRHPSRKIYMLIGLENGTAAIAKRGGLDLNEKDDENLIDTLGLSVRSWNCLKRAGINTIDQLTQYAEWELSELRNMGVRTLKEIKECLASRGLSLKDEEET